MYVIMSKGLNGPFLSFSFKRHSSVHNQIDHPQRLLVFDFKPDFNKPLCLSVMPAAVGLYGT